MKRKGYGSIRCGICGRTPKSSMLIVIDGNIFCRKCLKRIRVKDTGERGSYYTHQGNRCFIQFRSKRKIRIEEFKANELLIGRKSNIG
ncbi:hypothetical protein [Wukongibacter sp. M2B1]|uniref:hypothetical protein n=1 Tax=Wukongibacter sp. M2B1 TaxID=3088895 RepID=UPI003D7B5D1C